MLGWMGYTPDRLHNELRFSLEHTEETKHNLSVRICHSFSAQLETDSCKGTREGGGYVSVAFQAAVSDEFGHVRMDRGRAAATLQCSLRAPLLHVINSDITSN